MKKGFRILKFKKDKAIFEVKDVSKSYGGRPILKKLSLKVFPGNVLEFSGQMVAEKQLYFLYVLENRVLRVDKYILTENL